MGRRRNHGLRSIRPRERVRHVGAASTDTSWDDHLAWLAYQEWLDEFRDDPESIAEPSARARGRSVTPQETELFELIMDVMEQTWELPKRRRRLN